MSEFGHKVFALTAAAGMGAAAVLGGERLINHVDTQDERPLFPSGLVCVTDLDYGESPAELAEESFFADDTESVIKRSQFLNPDSVLSYQEGDEANFNGAFNVMRAGPDDEHSRPTFSPSGRVYSAGSNSSCLKGDLGEVEQFYPNLESAEAILRSTVAVKDDGGHDDVSSPIARWRCGGIAITDSVVLLPSQSYAEGFNDCGQLASAEADDELLTIEGDVSESQWRYVTLGGAALDPVDIATIYEPNKGDTLIYSGYDQGGARQYFRMSVESSVDGRLILRAGVDRVHPLDDRIDYNDIRYPQVEGGGGGIFTPYGDLVAIIESTHEFQKIGPYYALDQATSIQDTNRHMEQWLTSQGVVFDPGLDSLREPAQYVSALMTNGYVDITDIPSN